MNKSRWNIFAGAVIAVGVIALAAGVYMVNHPAPQAVVAGESTGPLSTAITEVGSGKAVLIDVRTPAEYASGHAKGAINFDSVRIQAGELPSIAKDAKVYIYCRSGHRAGLVLPILQKAGYADVTNLGALQTWQDAGGPVS